MTTDQIQVAETADDIAVRDEFEDFNVAVDDRKHAEYVCRDVAGSGERDNLALEKVVRFGTHRPKFGSACVARKRLSRRDRQRGPECSAGQRSIDRQDVRGVQINPFRRIDRVAVRAIGLRQTGNHTERHFIRLSLAVKDRLVHRVADGFGDHFNEGSGEIDVAFGKDRIAKQHVAADLVAGDLNLRKCEIQLVKGVAAALPDCLRNETRDRLSCFAAHVTDANAVEQLGIPEHVFRDDVEHRHGDGQLCAGDTALRHRKRSDLRQEFLDVVLLDDRRALLIGAVDRLKCALVLRERSDVDVVLHFVFLSFTFFGVVDVRDLALFGFQLGGQRRDLILQRLARIFVRGALLFERVDLIVDLCAFLIGDFRRFRFADRLFELCFARFEFLILCAQRFQLGIFAVNLRPQQNCFQHVFMLLSAFSKRLRAILHVFFSAWFLPVCGAFQPRQPPFPCTPETYKRTLRTA